MRFLPIVVATFAVALLVGCSADPKPAAPGVSDSRKQAVQADIDRMVESGVAGAIATVTENGATVILTSGVADRDTRAPILADPPQQTRIGSISKSFIASVVLQLVAEGKIRLDEPIDTYLPGLLVGDGIDGRAITVRHILRHQSGLPELTDDPQIDEYRVALQGRTVTPEQEVASALMRPAVFAPGTRWEYTNTNYIVAGMLVERVTGAPYTEELNRRILRPLALEDTYLPGTGELDIRGPHPKGYASVDGVMTDVTRIEPSVPWAAGAMVSTGVDLNHFYSELLAGRVVPAVQLAEMRAGVSMGSKLAGMNYGLGIGSMHLPCGAEYVGHIGGIYGFLTISGATPEGRAITYAFTQDPESQPDIPGMLSRALCP
ncbi:serine hydrolase domain-containing protein [Nocardia sp. NBC_01009]|uniref:serine hydrolase domain-containing protein n=1 Tax=Nocardia sp. NBC_01009 TaxID=2975996 RepID=UPI003867AD44|nr:beta-lactamase family protein [Nocardia sp. NBC_01009]